MTGEQFDMPQRGDPPTSATGHAAPPRDPTPRRASPSQSDAGKEEVDVWRGRSHWKHFAAWAGLWCVGNAVAAVGLMWLGRRVEWLNFWRGVGILAVILVASGLELVGRRILLKVLRCRYRLTTQRLFIQRGILRQTIDQTELMRVDDVRIYKSVLDRIFGLGSVLVRSTDASDRDVVIEGIREPDQVAEAIRSHMQTMRRRSLFVETL